VAAGANAAALLGADAAALVAAGAALVTGGALGVAALPEDLLLAHPAAKSAAIPRKTVALIAVDGVRNAIFILKLLHMRSCLLLRLVFVCHLPRRLRTSSRSTSPAADLQPLSVDHVRGVSGSLNRRAHMLK
jgi:hypothetical protein